MSDKAVTPAVPAGVPEPLPDDENPALIDAKKTFVITLWSAIMFIAIVAVFILF